MKKFVVAFSGIVFAAILVGTMYVSHVYDTYDHLYSTIGNVAITEAAGKMEVSESECKITTFKAFAHESYYTEHPDFKTADHFVNDDQYVVIEVVADNGDSYVSGYWVK